MDKYKGLKIEYCTPNLRNFLDSEKCAPCVTQRQAKRNVTNVRHRAASWVQSRSELAHQRITKMEEGNTGETVFKMDVQNESEECGEDISPGKDGGVRKIIKVQGHGKEKPPVGSKVRVYYSGKLLSGEEFDSNIGKKEPFEFEHGKGNFAL